jgi:hypothetical protein
MNHERDLQAEAAHRTPQFARFTLVATAGAVDMTQTPEVLRPAAAALAQQLTKMRSNQLARCKARTGVGVFPVPAAPGSRGRWVRGVIEAEAAAPWLERFLEMHAALRGKEGADAARSAEAALEVRCAAMRRWSCGVSGPSCRRRCTMISTGLSWTHVPSRQCHASSGQVCSELQHHVCLCAGAGR